MEVKRESLLTWSTIGTKSMIFIHKVMMSSNNINNTYIHDAFPLPHNCARFTLIWRLRTPWRSELVRLESDLGLRLVYLYIYICKYFECAVCGVRSYMRMRTYIYCALCLQLVSWFTAQCTVQVYNSGIQYQQYHLYFGYGLRIRSCNNATGVDDPSESDCHLLCPLYNWSQ